MYKILSVMAVVALLISGCSALPKVEVVKTKNISQNYQMTKNAAISGYNDKQLKNVSVSSCMTACENANWCKSFDYYKFSNKCDLSSKNANDVGGLKTNYNKNPYDHYSHITR